MNKTSRKSQHFLCCSDFHLVNVRKVLSGQKSLCFTNVGISMEARGRAKPRVQTALLDSRGHLGTARQYGRRAPSPGWLPWLLSAGFSCVRGRLGFARARCECTRSDGKPHPVPSMCVLTPRATERVANEWAIPAFTVVFIKSIV